jgi:hypothetical protein
LRYHLRRAALVPDNEIFRLRKKLHLPLVQGAFTLQSGNGRCFAAHFRMLGQDP